MTGVLTVALRELLGLFRVPVGWVVLALYLFLTGVLFSLTGLEAGTPASLRGVFGASVILVVLVAPAVSMRLVSDELRTGTIEGVLSAPISSLGYVLGKYLAGLGFVVLLVLPMLVHALVLREVSTPATDLGPVLAGMLSLVLLGSLCVSVGLLASSLTESQTLAFLGTVLALIGWILGTTVAPAYAPAWLAEWLSRGSIGRRIDDFARGVIDLGHVLAFVSVSCWFVLAAGCAVEARRWR
jgi:ABC-2 type transport system permease protein